MVCGLEVCDELDEGNAHVNGCEGDCTDEMTGMTLLRDDVPKAREEEMSWYDKFEAYEEMTDETRLSRTGRKPTSCRWKNINKDDSERVEVRSRLLSREIKPPSALVRYVISRATTKSNDDYSWYLTTNEHSYTLTL